jgi:hypothetical protein
MSFDPCLPQDVNDSSPITSHLLPSIDDAAVALPDGDHWFPVRIRDRLATSIAWAASPEIVDRLCWIRDGSRRRLVWSHNLQCLKRFGDRATKLAGNAELSIMGQLTIDDCWMIPKGEHGSLETSPLDDILVCRLTPVNNAILIDDFDRTWTNLQALMNAADIGDQRGVLYQDLYGRSLRFQHIPFVVCIWFYDRMCGLTHFTGKRTLV